MGITLGGLSNDAMNALPSRQLATAEPFRPDAQEVAHEKTLPLPAGTLAYHHEQFVKHDPTSVHPLPPQHSAIHSGPVVGRIGDAVSLNPQPLPPRDVFAQVEAALHGGVLNSDAANRGIIIIGGREASNPELNRAIIIIGGKVQG